MQIARVASLCLTHEMVNTPSRASARANLRATESRRDIATCRLAQLVIFKTVALKT